MVKLKSRESPKECPICQNLYGYYSVNMIRSNFGTLIRQTRRHPKKLVSKGVWVDHLSSLLPIQTEHDLIRLDPVGDGGYLIPNDLYGVEMCISPGTENVAGFETELLDYGIKSMLIDKDESGKPADLPYSSTFVNKFVSGFDSEETVSLNTLVEISGVSGNLILQIDIEDHEYNALNSISSINLARFRIIVIEFHYTFDWIFEHNWDWPYQQIFAKSLESHSVVHNHPITPVDSSFTPASSTRI